MGGPRWRHGGHCADSKAPRLTTLNDRHQGFPRTWDALHRQGRSRRKPAHAAVCRTRGFSLVELLAVIAVVGVLVGMLLPAAQAARESARRATCANNLRQLTLALLGFEGGQGRFPRSARVSDKDTCTACFDAWGEAQRSGVGPGDEKHGTGWILEVLPHLDQMAIYSAWDRSTNVMGNAAIAQTDIPLLYCPTRRGGIRVGSGDHENLLLATWRGGGTDYGGCLGRVQGFRTSADDAIDGRHRFAGTDMVYHGNGPKEGIFRPDAAIAAAAIHDGLTNTVLTGELQRLRRPSTGTATERGRSTSQDGWALGGVATLFVTATGNPNANPGGLNNLFFESPGSDHAGGATFGMADGSVHFLSEFVDARDNNAVFPLLGSMRDQRGGSLADIGP
jgi:prepilin-type N-terminal cleavage/methylation domain-containing protein